MVLPAFSLRVLLLALISTKSSLTAFRTSFSLLMFMPITPSLASKDSKPSFGMEMSVRQMLPASTAPDSYSFFAYSHPSFVEKSITNSDSFLQQSCVRCSAKHCCSLLLFSSLSPSTPQQKRQKPRHSLILSVLQLLECYQAIP